MLYSFLLGKDSTGRLIFNTINKGILIAKLIGIQKQGVKTCPNTYAVYAPAVYMHSATLGHNGAAMHIYTGTYTSQS